MDYLPATDFEGIKQINVLDCLLGKVPKTAHFQKMDTFWTHGK